MIADMHCDSLLKVSAERGLLSDYNVSRKKPFLQFTAAFVPAGKDTPAARRRKLIGYLDTYLSETHRCDLVRVDCAAELHRALDFSLSATVLTVEGGGGLFADSEELQTLYRAGLRVLGLCWDSNELAAGAWDSCDTGLTEEGKKLARTASEMGITPDVSHLSDRSFDELLDTVRYPVLATHSNFRAVTNSPRNLTLSQAERIVARGGVIGLNLCPAFLTEKEHADATDILRHVDYALSHLGDRALAFGCDIDGIEEYPRGFEPTGSIHDKLCDLLLSHYPAKTVERIAGENVTDFLRSNLFSVDN